MMGLDSDKSMYASRITQLDSIILDSELEKLLKSQLSNLLHKIQRSRWTSEAELLLSFVVWKFSAFDRNSTVGQRLLGLEYSNSGKRRLIYLFVLDKILPYIQRKILQFAQTRRLLWNLIEKCLKSSQLLNFLTFLLQNQYASLSHRFTRLQMKSISGKLQSSVGYSYQIRELLWHQFTDILMMILPLININQVMSYFSKSNSRINGAYNEILNSGTSTNMCCYCKEDPTIPNQIGNCTFCYFCLKANQKSDSNFRCTTHEMLGPN